MISLKSLLIEEDENGEVLISPSGCTSQAEVLGLIEAARISARCTFIRTNALRSPELKEVESGDEENRS